MTDDAAPAAADSAKDALRLVTELCERIRERHVEARALVEERDAAVREAIARFGCSHRELARATALSVGRIHEIHAAGSA